MCSCQLLWNPFLVIPLSSSQLIPATGLKIKQNCLVSKSSWLTVVNVSIGSHLTLCNLCRWSGALKLSVKQTISFFLLAIKFYFLCYNRKIVLKFFRFTNKNWMSLASSEFEKMTIFYTRNISVCIRPTLVLVMSPVLVKF